MMFFYSGILEVMDIKLKLLQNSHDSEHLSLLVHVGLEVEFDTSLHDRTSYLLVLSLNCYYTAFISTCAVKLNF